MIKARAIYRKEKTIYDLYKRVPWNIFRYNIISKLSVYAILYNMLLDEPCFC